MKQYRVAVVGATGMVGRKFLQVLEERKLPVSEYFLFASARSAGTTLPFMGKEYTIRELTKTAFDDLHIDIALFSAGGGTSAEFAPIVAASGAVVIDNSSQWRMDPDVPLVEELEGAAALGVDDALRDALAVEVGQLLDQVHVVDADAALGAGGDGVLLGGNGGAVEAGGGTGGGSGVHALVGDVLARSHG